MGMFIDGKWHIQDVNKNKTGNDRLLNHRQIISPTSNLNLKPTVTIWLYRMPVPGLIEP